MSVTVELTAEVLARLRAEATRRGVSIDDVGDAFYQSVGARADVLIDRWYRQQKEDQR